MTILAISTGAGLAWIAVAIVFCFILWLAAGG